MAVITLTQHNFDDIIADNDLVVIDFWAQWCAPCKGFAEVVQKAAVKHKDVCFAKVNIETEPSLAKEFNVRSVPWVMILREQVAVYDDSGALSGEALDELVEQAKALDIEAVKAQLAENEDSDEDDDV